MRNSRLLAAVAVAAIAIPAVAQIAAPTNSAAPATPAAPAQPAPTSPTPSAPPAEGVGESETGVVELDTEEAADQPPPTPVEMPGFARRDSRLVGRLDPVDLGLGASPWKGASGAFLASLMRRMDTPVASRWAHIALRNALLARAVAPRNVNPVDWAAERAWLLLRMGEADAGRMIIANVDVDRFTPRMFQVGVEGALANADPAALCPLQDGIQKADPKIFQVVDAMCAAMAGEPEQAAAQVDAARRRGRMTGIDLELAEKVVGAGGNTNRAVDIKWDPVDRLDTWRFGLATATGMTFPDRLIDAAPSQMRAWQAAAPVIAPSDRLASAQIAAGLGVFSSQAMADLYSTIYDSTGPDDLPGTDAWQLRQAFVGKDVETKLAAMRKLWGSEKDYLELEAARATLGRAATLIEPDKALQTDAPNLVASMLAAGFDKQAARWSQAASQMDDQYADQVWAMLALGAPDGAGIDVSAGRINSFIDRDNSEGKKRSALLVAGLAGLGRIDQETAGRISGRSGLRLDRRSPWTRMIDRAAAFGQAGTVLVLTGTGFQSPTFDGLPPAHVYHSIAALKRTGQDYIARMIAAEALART
ncbi:hypothetical protein [Sphingomonas daechungensis]|uniref:hypothetical protein n=1 Tax=Sphingomonas daechungensis TaxID=1176646 RepID=UPI003784566D